MPHNFTNNKSTLAQPTSHYLDKCLILEWDCDATSQGDNLLIIMHSDTLTPKWSIVSISNEAEPPLGNLTQKNIVELTLLGVIFNMQNLEIHKNFTQKYFVVMITHRTCVEQYV